jgi:glucose-6-phosphate isomerase
MALKQNVDLALEPAIGVGGLPRTAFEAGLAAAGTALSRLREDFETGRLALLQLPGTDSDLPEIEREAARLKAGGATDVVLLGTGGSSLGGQMLAQIADWGVPGVGRLAEGPRLHFMDNLDPITFGLLLERLPLETSRFVAISNPAARARRSCRRWPCSRPSTARGCAAVRLNSFLGLSEPAKPNGKNALRRCSSRTGVHFLGHHTGVGGRYSALTNVGLLPAAILGLDIRAIRAGASEALAPVATARRQRRRRLPSGQRSRWRPRSRAAAST